MVDLEVIREQAGIVRVALDKIDEALIETPPDPDPDPPDPPVDPDPPVPPAPDGRLF